jgi:hypothetical protein
VLGGFGYSTSGVGDEPMFSLTDSAASFIFRESCFNRKPYAVLVRAARGGLVQTLAGNDVPRVTGGALLMLWSSPGESTKKP